MTRPPETTCPPRPDGADRGSVSAEIAVLVVPVMILLTVFIVFCGRTASAAIDVAAAAGAAARAAADTRTPAQAGTAADTAVRASTAGTRWTCIATVDDTDLRTGGQVRVTVTCQVPLGDLGLPGPSSRTVHASATEPIDTYRADNTQALPHPDNARSLT